MSELVSVVLPVHNGELFLADAMESVLGQTYSHLELIVVDDASTDQSLRIAESFSARDSRVRLIVNEHNLKLPRTLNRGFESSRGRYVTWTSDDNLMSSSFLERMVHAVETKSVDFVFCNYSEIDVDGTLIRMVKTSGPSALIRRNTIGAGFLYESRLLQIVGGFDDECFLYEDYEYWTRIARSGSKMLHLDEDLYRYRVHPRQLSATHRVPPALLSFRQQLLETFPSTRREIAKASVRLALDLSRAGRWSMAAHTLQVGWTRILGRQLPID